MGKRLGGIGATGKGGDEDLQVECETRGVECVAFPPEWVYAEN